MNITLKTTYNYSWSHYRSGFGFWSSSGFCSYSWSHSGSCSGSWSSSGSCSGNHRS